MSKIKNKLPLVIPPGWTRMVLPATATAPPGVCIIHQTISGLRCMFSIDPCGSGGAWERHLSMSRADRYPGWDEMKDMIYGAGLMDPNKPVQMILPPKNLPQAYVNLHVNTFHWFQAED